MASSVSLTLQQIVGLNCFLIALALAFVVGRIYVRLYKLNTRLNASDHFVIIGWVMLIAWATSTGLAWKHNGYSWADDQYDTLNTTLQQCLFAAKLLFDFGLYFPKFSLLALYYAVVDECFRKTRMSLHVITAITILSCLATLILDFAICIPFSLQFSTVHGKCSSWTSLVSYAFNFALNMLCDIMVFTFPFSFLSKMKISQKARAGLIGTFALGVVTILVGASRFAVRLLIWSLPVTIVFATAELASALIVVTLPILRHLFREPAMRQLSSGPNSYTNSEKNRSPGQSMRISLDTSSWS